jgi:hypothetical protein
MNVTGNPFHHFFAILLPVGASAIGKAAMFY